MFSVNKRVVLKSFCISHLRRSTGTLQTYWHKWSLLQLITFMQSTGLLFSQLLARAAGVAVGRLQAVDWQRRLWTTIFIIIFHHFFHFFFSVATFSHRRSARIKKLIQRKWLQMANNLGWDPFPDAVGHFGAPSRPFWILQAVQLCRRRASAPSAARLVFSNKNY